MFNLALFILIKTFRQYLKCMNDLFCFCVMADNFGMTIRKKQLENLSSTAAKVGVPKKWLLEKANAGLIPHIYISNSRRLFNIAAVEEALLQLAAEGHDA